MSVDKKETCSGFQIQQHTILTGFGKPKDVYVSKDVADDWIRQSMTYANCEVVEIHTQNKTYGQVSMQVKNNVDSGTILVPKAIMAQFEVSVGDKVLVKPILMPS